MGINFEKYAKRGTDGSDRKLRIFDSVQDRSYAEPPQYLGQPAIIGYPFDIGVERNNGRIGARGGPEAIRKALANLAWHRERLIADLGDVSSNLTNEESTDHYFDLEDQVESSQNSLYVAVSSALEKGYFPVVLGGGHDLAAATTLAALTTSTKGNSSCAILNFDAHFDLRAAPQANSGTGFLQAFQISQLNGRFGNYNYFAVGISEPSNSALLFEAASHIGARFLLDRDVSSQGMEFIAEIIESFDRIYISVDLDSIEAPSMKAVSAPAPFGISVTVLEGLLIELMESGKVAGIDFAEFNPNFDDDTLSSRVVARLIHTVLTRQTSITK